jgi:hypothetical protein
MAKNDAVPYKDYLIYPLALYVKPEAKWQAMALITRDMNDENLTLPRSQSFPKLPGMFDDEEAALDYALKYGRQLVDGGHDGLKI